ncbi:transcription elongation factor Spt5 [Xylona heveae TC161]|uniref:Transcription elongation factor SPT5 n=1 Tax=Xylona heveae (strain CBS 132557 / TC161) TaxID=1328760 RepID=A0A165JG59_XYLHT|nr:transcription elongation factor Spt5 [Xylona heveae TC161]KZF26193.1 transcription elongation factor Spt5 [Xylona heveae TC161]
MSTANFLDQDFGSESEDDTFNPAPAEESDHEDAAGESDNEVAPGKSRRVETARGSSPTGDNGDEDDERARPSEPRQNGRKEENGNAEDDGEDGGAGGDAEEEEDEEERDEEDEDEEEEEEDDDEEEISGHRRKRARRDRRNQFLDVEAEVDEDEDEEVEDDEELAPDGFIADTHPDDLADLPAGAEIDDRRHRELDRRRELEAGLDAEKQAAAYKERYGRSRPVATDSVVVPKRLLLPSVDDPSIWGVRCKPGKEREVIFGIMKRVEERVMTKAPLMVTAAFERGGTMTGYIYVEARKQADVLTALDGLSNVYPRTKTILVPIKEMPDLLRTTKSKTLEPGMYVRIKRGKYQGDLAQIDEVETNGLEVSLRIVPRLDYGMNEDANAPIADAAAKRKRAGFGANNLAGRAPQRLFSEAEAKKKHLKYLQQVSTLDRKHWSYLGETYINGFLIKDMKIQHLQTEDVNPTLEEVTKFTAGAEDGTENLDLAALAASLKASTATASYLPGDMIEVYDGEQRGVCGKAVSVHGDIVTLNVTEGELVGQTIEAPIKCLRKRFREGDHVKVVGGSRFRDEVGMVVRISDDRVTLISDASMQEITVFSKDLREAADAGGTGKVGNFELHDLVQLDSATVACIIKVDRESLRVLDQHGSVRFVLPSQIPTRLDRRRNAVATDRNGSEIRTDDTIRETGGEGRQGQIMHIYRSYIFAHNREQAENAGIFVVRTTNVATVAAKGGRVTGAASHGPDLSKMNPAVQRNGGVNGGGGGAMPPPRNFGRDRLLGKTVAVRKGPYKGLLGIVKDTTDTEARIELHSKSKVISVPKESLSIKDPVTGQSIEFNKFSGGRGRGGGGPGAGPARGSFGGATPSRVPTDWQGSRTPMASAISGGRTPAWGSGGRTPAWSGAGAGAGAGGRTPAWKQDAFGGGATGGRTPAWGAADGNRTVNPYDGSRTAYGSGGRTPAWNPGARTPYGGSAMDRDPYGSSDSFGSGAKTPAYGGHGGFSSGSKTPAYGGHGFSSSSSAAAAASSSSFGGSSGAGAGGHDSWSSSRYDAPTPGGGALSAPTPGALNAPTPGAYSAPTPGGSGAGPAHTPGASASGGTGGSGADYHSAPTPAASAPTPGAARSYGHAAATPGNWGGDDDDDDDDAGPRYEEGTPSP